MNSSEKNARIVWRMKSVEVSRVMPEPVRDLGGDRPLAGAGRAADQQDHGQIELLELVTAAQSLDRFVPFDRAEHLDRQLVQALQLDGALVTLARSISTCRASS